MSNLRVLVADSSATYKKMITKAAAELDKGAVVTRVADGGEALEKIRCCDYEIIIIDADVAELNVLLKKIKVQIPKAFVLVTARPSSFSDTLCAESTKNGADDCLIKPIQSSYGDNYEVVKQKLSEIFKLMSTRLERKAEKVESDRKAKKTETDGKAEKAESDGLAEESIAGRRRFKPGIVLIAASTGGPQALEAILPGLRNGFPVPILVVQHMLPQFTDSLAHNLNAKTALRVKVGEEGEIVKAGTVYFAPGGKHMRLDGGNTILFDESPPINGVRPAADVLFESVAEQFEGKGVLAVILTGMGHDGARGVAMLKEKQDCLCVTQSEETCVVYGMPRVAVERGLSDRVFDLDKIPGEIEKLCFARG